MVQTIDGHVPNYVNPATRVPEFLGVQISLTVLALIIVLLRVYTRKFMRNVFGIEDWLTILAIFLLCVATICSGLGVIGGTGLHYYDLPKTVNKRLAASASFANQVLYQPVLCLTKISISMFYISTFGAKIKKPCQAIIGFSILFLIACTVVEFTQCRPPDMLWNGTRPKGYKCINQPMFFKVTGFISLAIDLAIFIVPLPVVWTLNAPARTRLALVLIFSVGLVSMGAEVARLVIWFHKNDGNRQNPDSTWNRVDIVDWSCIEQATGIICASLPHLKALFAKYMPGLVDSLIRSSRGGSGALGYGKKSSTNTSHIISSPNPKDFKIGDADNTPSSHRFSQLKDDNSEEYMLDTIGGPSGAREKKTSAIIRTTEWSVTDR
ncbi:uncharacterized protein BDZ99DRAFT_476533 [Mytilinidion resinicola]|uniref:Rhodopsin domain-containing protein n=1 Tax=Mytilinidion resinicola TaxID=574789 RepID=A0A6A6YNB5_9PEZI|nr:uncharacterized protein BDZ99DRAFT_476533 [Mytilinidion resinicola]KAF2810362.1 hypothetical protein BDZ99DRAFT_476533 [Mytilinidion resinicola]